MEIKSPYDDIDWKKIEKHTDDCVGGRAEKLITVTEDITKQDWLIYQGVTACFRVYLEIHDSIDNLLNLDKTRENASPEIYEFIAAKFKITPQKVRDIFKKCKKAYEKQDTYEMPQ